MNPLFNQLNALGYTDCFYQDDDLWGFLNNSVMPAPIPQEIVNAAEQQDSQDRLADWPKFSRREQFKFWCDRIWHNLFFRLDRQDFQPFKIGNVVITGRRTLILGNYILFHRHKNRQKHSGSDLFHSLARDWGQRVKTDIFHSDWPASSYVLNGSCRGSDRALVLSVREKAAYDGLTDKFNEGIATWIICNCDRDLAEIAAEETGAPAHYFYALPSHLFWVYSQKEQTMILGQIINRESLWEILKEVWLGMSPSLRTIIIVMIALGFFPQSLAKSILVVLIGPAFLFLAYKGLQRNHLADKPIVNMKNDAETL